MMLTLRELKYLVRDALFEGVEQDRQELIKSFPDQEGDIARLGPKWIMWLMARFGPSAKFEEIHPFADALATVKSYSQRDAAISQKYNSSEQWRQAVDQAFPNRKWKNPADVMTMTSDDMETLLAMSQRKKQNVDVNQISNVEQDRIGKVGPWNLWMPTTKENSCQIAGYDPATMKPYASWCTARTSGSNLFYNYVGRQGTILFYLIKDDAKTSSDRLSVGFVNGKPVLGGQSGGVSVDGDNNGLNEKKLRSLLGGHYDQIMETLQNVADKNKGIHPAQKKFAEAAQSLDALKSMLKGLSKEEQHDLKEMIIKQSVSDEVAYFLLQTNDAQQRLTNICRLNNSVVLTQLAQDENIEVRQCVAENPNTSVKVLAQLAQDENANIRRPVALNTNTPIEVLTYLAQDEDDYTRQYVANNPNTPVEVLAQLAQDKDHHTRHAVARHKNTSVEILTQLAQDQNRDVRSSVAKNINAPTELLLQLAHDEDQHVRHQVAQNPNTTNDILKSMLKHVQSISDEQDYYDIVRTMLLRNSLSDEILDMIATHPALNIRKKVAKRNDISFSLMSKLAQDSEYEVRFEIANLPDVPVSILRQLAQDQHPRVAAAARIKLKKDYDEGEIYEQVLKRLARILF